MGLMGDLDILWMKVLTEAIIEKEERGQLCPDTMNILKMQLKDIEGVLEK